MLRKRGLNSLHSICACEPEFLFQKVYKAHLAKHILCTQFQKRHTSAMFCKHIGHGAANAVDDTVVFICHHQLFALCLFPDNFFVETVVLLSKGEIDSKKVRVEFSLEDMDMSGFQKGATYEQIKAYVLEHTGLKVSSLYISQIKRKCGLDVGQNYNLSKKEDAKVPKCPPEKEAAIRDALKYFQMI